MANMTVSRDPNTHSYSETKSDSKPSSSGGSSGGGSSSSSSSSSSDGGGGGSFSLPSETTNGKTAKGKAQKKQNKRAYYTLSGTLNYIPSNKGIKIQAGDTVKLKGLGSYLSGTYYVAEVTRTINASEGYSQSMEVYKPNFRKTLKTKNKQKSKGGKSSGGGSSSPKKVSRRALAATIATMDITPTVPTTSSGNKQERALATETDVANRVKVKTYTVQSRSDTPYTVALRFYGDATKWKRMYYQNTGEAVDPKRFAVGTVICLP